MKRFLVLVMTSILAVWPIASCGGGEPAPFSLEVIPEQMEDSVPGQRCVFLVTVEDNDVGKAVNISAQTDSQWWRENTTVTVNPKAIVPGLVAEVIEEK